MNNDVIEQTKAAIQRFLTERPGSADTLEGIHNWWIQWSDQPESIDVTLKALEQLELQSVVEVQTINQRQIWRKAR